MQSIFPPKCLMQFDFAQKKEQKLPNFSPQTFPVIRLITICLDNFSPRAFWGHSMYQKLCLEQGEMLPNFFPTNFCGDSIYQICLDKLLGVIRCIKFGGNAAQFFYIPNFWGHSMYQLLCLEQGKMLPKFSPRTCWVIRVIISGENAVQSFPTSFLG